MVDANIKKVVIPKAELPAIDSSNFSYNIRYRIISEDKNRSSYWSNVQNIEAEAAPSLYWTYVKENLKSPTGGVVKSVRFDWHPDPEIRYTAKDVFVKRCSSSACTEDWEYVSTTSTDNYAFIQTGSETHVQITVQLVTYPKQINSSATLFTSTAIDI